MSEQQPQQTAEQFLIDQGVFRNESGIRQRLLACIGCQLARSEVNNEDPRAYMWPLERCTGSTTQGVKAILAPVVAAGLMARKIDSEVELLGTRPSARQYYRLTDLPEAAALGELLMPPARCWLPEALEAQAELPDAAETIRAMLDEAVTLRRSQMTQSAMASRLDATPQQVLDLERGKSVALPLLVRYLSVLGYRLTIEPEL